MFGNSKKETSSNGSSRSSSVSSSSSSGSINTIVNGCSVDGNVNTNNDIRIDGKLSGTLDCKGKVIIGPQGFVDGNITCANAVIEGKFEGALMVKELLNVKETAQINGEINTNKLIVQSGAVFNVGCKMGGQTIKEFSPKKSEKKEGVVNFG